MAPDGTASRRHRLSLTLAALLAVSACAVTPPAPPSQPPTSSDPPVSPSPPATSTPVDPGAPGRCGAAPTRADRELRHLMHEIEGFYRSARLNDALIGLRNATQVARTVTFAAQRNRFSRGAHYRADDLSQDDPAQQALVQDVLMRR